MATVEQREPSGLPLSNDLDFLNDFKDEKDSDEESFHLPMLDCDEDLDSNNKEALGNNDKDHQCQNNETEDDILDKFETTVTTEIDPKVEDKLLNEIDEVSEQKSNEKNEDTCKTDHLESKTEALDKEVIDPCSNLNVEQESEKTQDIEKKCLMNDDISQGDKADEIFTQSAEKTEDTEVICEEEQAHLKISEIEDKNNSTNEDGVMTCVTVTDEPNDDMEDTKKREETEMGDNTKVITKVEENVTKEIKDSKAKNVEKNAENNNPHELINNNMKPSDCHETNNANSPQLGHIPPDVTSKSIEDETIEASSRIVEPNIDDNADITVAHTLPDGKKYEISQNKTDIIPGVATKIQEMKCEEEKMEIDEHKIKHDHLPETIRNELKESIAREKYIGVNKEADKMDIDILDNAENNNASLLDSNVEEVVQGTNNVEDNVKIASDDGIQNNPTSPCDTDEMRVSEGDIIDTKKETETSKHITHASESTKENSTQSKSESVVSNKSENSNDSNKNLECDDLLSISIIRDADEDNASAIAENANDGHSSDKSDNDDQDEGSEKADNEVDESEMDQDETILANDKDDRMEFEDGNSSNLAYQENSVSETTSDSEAKDDIKDSESESNTSSVLKEKTNSTNNTVCDENNQTEESITESKNVESQSVAVGDQDSIKENSVKLGGKRSLSNTDATAESIGKKLKLSDSAIANEKKKNKRISTLVSFEKFMQKKKFDDKLTISDLEQFCLQKICEAIVHKTEVGELHQTIKKQELIIDNLRKDLQQLSKQTRDLDIVNKKLMNELRAQNGIKKPLVPLKITRSVGLQVKLNLGIDSSARRKTPIVAANRTPNTPNNARQRTIPSANSNVVRQVASSPRKTPTTTTPLLSQALQNSRATPVNTIKRQPIRPKPAEPQKPANPGVIDLTDEDDKASKAAGATSVKVVNKSIPLNQAKTLNIVPNKTLTSKGINPNQNKTVPIGQVKATAVSAKVGTPTTRTVTTIPQGVRLTPTQVKTGSITLPASVVTSNAGTQQLMYVVPTSSIGGQVVTSTSSGPQKAVLLNFQSTNGVLTSALNGSSVSVIPTKVTNAMQLKSLVPKKHPAPLPCPPPSAVNGVLKPLLPKPHLTIRKTDTGIILQWRMPYNLDIYESIASYQLFAYQETNAAPSTDMWRKVGDVKALALPMACTLTQFADKNKYYFAVRSVDVHKRIGAFSDPEEISL